MKITNFKKILDKFPLDYDVCLTSYCMTNEEKIKEAVENAKDTETITLKNKKGEEFFDEAPRGYENIYIEVVDDIILGLNVDKEEKKIRFVILNDLVKDFEVLPVEDIKQRQPLRLVKK